MKPLAALAFLAGLALALPAAAGELRLNVEGLKTARGTMLIGLYDSKKSFDRAIELSDKEGFLNDPERVAGIALRIGPQLKSGIVFRDLEPGRYAVILFHDEDGNGRLTKNFWGVPIEAYGFSNDAQGFLGPPTFKDAAMTLDGADKAITISLVHHASGLVSLLPGYLEEDAAPAPKPAAAVKPASAAVQ